MADLSGHGAAPPLPEARKLRELARLLRHPVIWRAGRAARIPVWPSGFAALDEGLPGGGWPQVGLIEILPARFGMGELALVLPLLAAVMRRPEARWCLWVAPPLQPFAPALEAAGVALQRLLIVRASRSGPRPACLWAFEQALGSGACDVVFAWTRQVRIRQIRRLQLAAQQGGALGVLFRPPEALKESSAALLRVAVEPLAQGLRIRLLKSRGGARGAIDLSWPVHGAIAPERV